MLCPSCETERQDSEIYQSKTILPKLVHHIQKENDKWSSNLPVCKTCIRKAMALDAQEILESFGKLTSLDYDLLAELRSGDIRPNTSIIAENPQTRIESLADSVANTIGTFSFSGLVLLFVSLWLIFGFSMGFEAKHPAVLFGGLNAVLGTVAAIQNPIILMSQRRAAQHDRIRSQNEYRINLKSALETHYLAAKLDYLLQKSADEQTELEAMSNN